MRSCLLGGAKAVNIRANTCKFFFIIIDKKLDNQEPCGMRYYNTTFHASADGHIQTLA